jgi:hypothetical protein
MRVSCYFVPKLCPPTPAQQVVRLAHRRGGQYSEFTEFFGGDVEFGAAVDEIAFAPTIKNTPVVSGDNYLNNLLVTYCEEALARRHTRRGSFRASVENAIVPLPPHGNAKLPAVARRLGLSHPSAAARRGKSELFRC